MTGELSIRTTGYPEMNDPVKAEDAPVQDPGDHHAMADDNCHRQDDAQDIDPAVIASISTALNSPPPVYFALCHTRISRSAKDRACAVQAHANSA